MNNIKERIFNILKCISNTAEKIASIGCIVTGLLMTIITVSAVFYRYVLNDPLSWGEELSRFLMIWMAVLAMGLVTKENSHPSIQFFMNKLSKRSRKHITIFVRILSLLYILILLKGGFDYVFFALRTRSIWYSLRIPMFWVYMILPIGIFFLLVQTLYLIGRETIIKPKNEIERNIWPI